MNARTQRAEIPNVNDDLAGARDVIIDWFINEAWKHRHPHPLIKGTCERLIAAGVPIYVFNAWVMTLHPDYFGVVHAWRDTEAEIKTNIGNHKVWNTPLVQNSPLTVIREGACAIRRKLCDPAWPREYQVLEDYADEGATDYAAMRLPSRRYKHNMVSIGTKRPGGFTTAELSLVDALLPYMARLTDIQALDFLATTLLDTYVGKDAGHEIMVGNIQRGDTHTIRAVIWLCDLRDFTTLSDTMPGAELIALLNDYFDCVGKPVRARGGEILKFIGDAMLAIFRIANEDELASACENALAAADEAQGLLGEMNEARLKASEHPIAFGIGLHVGDVMYGNIGVADRLDFTVIGPAVNLAARIEGLCRELGQTIILSEEFAQASGSEFESLGKHKLKGLVESRRVFAPRATSAEAKRKTIFRTGA